MASKLAYLKGDDPLLDDLAVLELESPFGSSARARPILMATSRAECEKETACHAVRAVAGAGAHRARFRVVDAALVAEAHCATRVSHWADVRDRAFCFAGEELCPVSSDFQIFDSIINTYLCYFF